MKLLLDCDDVFDRLTRGPFPSGAEDDGAVEAHLRVCHECRELAEALRPAVDLLHNAYPGEALPSYQGEAAATLMPASVLRTNKKEWSLGWQLVAASLLGVVIGGLGASGWLSGHGHGAQATAAAQPNASGLAMLASLKLNEVCLPSSMALATTERLRCCTDCHSTGAGKKGVDVARLQLACVSCHDRSP
jgi:predicted anti-sigma-YlaC factor YlaD